MLIAQTNVPNFGLTRMKELLALRGNPHQQVPVIHIAGTNGKGSTSNMLAALLRECGVRVGVFSSPYLHSPTEQVVVDGQAIDETTWHAYRIAYQRLVDCDEHGVLADTTGFEILTAIAFEYFASQAVDVAIMEVGMGGLEDSTNVCESVLCGITSIGLDHTEWLGNTVSDIAQVKSGIIKQGIPVVFGNLSQEASQVMRAKANQCRSPYCQWQVDYEGIWQQSTTTSEQFAFTNQWRHQQVYTIQLMGKHQVENASLALQLADLWCHQQGLALLDEASVQRAWSQVVWHARLEVVSRQPFVLLDGAHNAHAMARLVETLNTRYAQLPKRVVIGCLQTKDLSTMLPQLQQVFDATIELTTFDDERAMTESQLRTYAKQYDVPIVSWQEVLDSHLQQLDTDTHLVFTGSLYFVAQVRAYFTKGE